MAKSFIERENIMKQLRRFKLHGKSEDSTPQYPGRRSAARRLTLGGCRSYSVGALSRKTIDSIIPVRLDVLIYDEESFSEGTYQTVDEIPAAPLEPAKKMMWIIVEGIHDEGIISQLGRRYNIHTLFQTDIKTPDQPTKLDVEDDALFLVCRLLRRVKGNSDEIIIEQMSFFLRDGLLITFQQQRNDVFDKIKERIQKGKGRVRRSKIDYLFYSLVDVIVDNYMDVLDATGTQIEEIDNQLIKPLKDDTLGSIYNLKHKMLFYRSAIYPLKEIIIKLQKDEETQIMQETTNIYLKDLFDHVIQVNDSIDTYREMLASFIDFHMMINSNAMNQVVKTLTIISTIFIPLTFITGIYGMNFANIPELRYENGYYIVLAVMATLAFFMLSIFKWKKWF